MAVFGPPQPECKPYVDHINRNPSDNRLANLRWVSPSENNQNRSAATIRHAPEPQGDLPGEEWRPSVTHPDKLRVSTEGRSQKKHYNGNWQPKTRPKVKKSMFCMVQGLYLHVEIAKTFIGPRPSEAHTVDHINHDRGDNRLANLRWATKLEQALNRTYVPISERSNGRKRKCYARKRGGGGPWEEYESQRAAARALSKANNLPFRSSNIGQVLNGKRPHCFGWEFRCEV